MSSQINEDDWEDAVDPRIKGELERLNNASHRINLLEKDHEDAQGIFRHTLAESASHLKSLYNKLGKKVDQARPYYETLHQTHHVHNESEIAAARYERACDNYYAAKDMVKKAEDKLCQNDRFLDSACQEMLNHATIKVMNANQERIAAERIHLEVSQAFNEMQEKASRLHKSLKSVINKTRPYFELKEKYNKLLEGHKRNVLRLQKEILDAKQEYHTALRNLETISDSIHEQRSTKAALLQPRGQGVGAEAPDQTCLVESERPEDILIQVEQDLEEAIKTLSLEDRSASVGEEDDEQECRDKQQNLDGRSETSLDLIDNNELDNNWQKSLSVKDSDASVEGGDDEQECHDEQQDELDERSETSLDFIDDKEYSNEQSVSTPKNMRVLLQGQLHISPLTPEQSDDEREDSHSIRLEKWFLFQPADANEELPSSVAFAK